MIDLDSIRERDARRTPITDADHDRRALLSHVYELTKYRARDTERIRELTLQVESLQNRWASRPLSHPAGEALAKENQDLRDTLELLVDYQNGCPLPSYEEQWTRAMQAAARLLGRSPPQNPCQP